MDFGALLHVAQKNSEQNKNSGGKYYSTKYSAPKKEAKEKTLSDNIKKFLAKKEKEQVEKAQEDKEKREKLLSLRDEKSKNKIRKMLKVIKSANKSVLQDAIDTENTAVTLHGPDQPDEDDYGYVSNEAAAAYKKYMEKIKAVPEENKFTPSRPTSRTDLSGTKNRVKVAIQREQIERIATSKSRPSKHLSNSPTTPLMAHSPSYSSQRRKDLYDPQSDKDEEERKRRDEQKKVRSDRGHSNPLGFQALLELAAIKQHQPIEIPVEQKKKEPERLLTKKEKKELEVRQKYLEDRERRRRESHSSSSKNNKPDSNEKDLNCKKQFATTAPNKKPLVTAQKTDARVHSSSPKCGPKKKPQDLPLPIGVKSMSHSSSGGSNAPRSKVLPSDYRNNNTVQSKATTKPACAIGKKSTGAEKGSHTFTGNNSLIPTGPKSGADRSLSSSKKSADVCNESSLLSSSSRQLSLKSTTSCMDQKTTVLNGKNCKLPTFPPPDVPRARQLKSQNRFSSDTRNSKTAKTAPKRRIYDEDDDEQDSDMDDFIDDGYEDGQNYSSYIKEIFGYDKSKYRDIDEDDAMESSFAQQMREEYVSKKIGIMEDLEDMRQEVEEKKKKVLMKKRKLK